MERLNTLRRNIWAQIIAAVGVFSAFVSLGRYWPYAVTLVLFLLAIASIPWAYERVTGFALVHTSATQGGRQLQEWQIVRLEAVLSNYPGQRVVILVAKGPETSRYADQFRQIFQRSKWKVRLEAAPAAQPAIDLQVSIYAGYFEVGPPQPILALRGAIDFVGLKCRPKFILDPGVAANLVVLWVGPESPKDMNPSNYPPLAVGRRIT